MKKLVQASKFMARSIRARLLRGNAVFCPICKLGYKSFLPYGVVARQNAQCPGCGSLERHRLLWLALEKYGLVKKGGRLLHVAPEPAITKRLKHTFSYISIDLDGHAAMKEMDVTQLDFTDGIFDLVICNHVLEHVKDDRKAIAELYRVMKVGGYGSIQVPMKDGETEEDDCIIDPNQRKQLYGQSDHVRLYGKSDFKRRLLSVGFEVLELSKAQLAEPVELARLSVDCEQEVILVRK